MDASELYLDLLKRTVTGTIYGREPNHDYELRDLPAFVRDFTEHYMHGHAHAMVPLTRLDNVQHCVTEVIQKGVEGDLIETGVWRGGTSIFMRGILAAHDVRDRAVWVADSFEGLPKPDPERFPKEARAVAGKTIAEDYKNFAASLEEVQANFRAYGLLDDQVHFLKGWFKDTLPDAPIKKLAVARLDGDLYESTRDALVALYPKVSVGGFVIIDDYGEDMWTECRRAVDEYRAENGIDDKIVEVCSKCVYWQRTG
jgi:hypothetical protein